jgi:hypothetical protein
VIAFGCPSIQDVDCLDSPVCLTHLDMGTKSPTMTAMADFDSVAGELLASPMIP